LFGRFMPIWLLFVIGQLVAGGLFFVLPAGPSRPGLLVAVNVLTVAALLVGTPRRRPHARAGWYLLAAGQALNAAAWICWYLYPVAAEVTLPVPSVGDLMFLASYGLSSVGLAWLARGHGARLATLIDALILATALGVLAWVIFLADSTDAGLTVPALVVNVGYVAMDVLLLAAAAAFAFTVGRSPRSLLLVGWAVLQLTGDLIFNLQILDGSFRLGNPVFGLWLASMAVLSGAALHPAPSTRATAGPRRWRQLVMVTAVVPLPILLVLRAVQSSTQDVIVIAGGSLLVTVLLVIRLTGMQYDAAITGEARKGLRRSVLRLCAGVVVLALLPLAGLAYLAIHEATSTVDSETRQRLAASADVSAAHVSVQMEGLQTLVASYAERPSLIRSMSANGAKDPGSVQGHLASLQSRKPSVVGVWALDTAGTLLAFQPPQPSLVGKNFAHRDYFKGAMRTRAPYVSEAFPGAAAGNPLVVAVSTPVLNGNRVLGTIGLGYRLDALAGFTDRLATLQNVQLELTDQRGTLLNGAGAAGPGLISATGDKQVLAALAGGSGTAREVEDGAEAIVAFRPIPGLGWTVVSKISAREAFAGSRRFTGRVVAVAWLLAQSLLAGLLLAVRTERRRRVAEAELAQREEQLTDILQVAGDAFVSTDAQGRVTRWNTRAETTFGWPAEEAKGRSLADLVITGEQQAADLSWATAVRSGGVTHLVGQRVEVQARRRDGDPFPAELTVCSSADERATFSAFIRDITDRKRAEAQVATSRDDALAASRMKSEFVANMSHEIRTPMNGVMGMTTLLLDTELDSRQRDYLTTVQNSAEALLNVINDILDFSKIEAGKLDIDPIDFDVRALVEEVVSLMAATAQAKRLEIAAVVNPVIPPALRGDVHRIRQILTNLVSNAVKFTEEGEVVVTVEVGVVDADRAVYPVTFTVSDTGIGVPASRQAHLFEAFTQVDASTTRRYGGTGLGLTISRQLVELMGGTIGLDSTLGEGSRFHFTLSLSAATAAFPALQQPGADLAGVRVLVVDDNATNRTVVGDLLTIWNMRPQTVNGANDALMALHAAVEEGDPFPVALLDMHMPDIDGLGLARMITADPVIGSILLAMLTSTNAEAEAARGCGIHAYLTKPIRAGQLHATLRQLLSRAAPPTDSKEERVSGTSPEQQTVPDARILVAEDNEVNQQVAVEILSSLGYTADVANDGEHALRLLQSRRYDAVLMDCQMPILDGFQATQQIRRLPPPMNGIPVIALTASALASDEQRCRAAGMNDFLTKPMRRANLADALRRVLHRRPERPDTATPDLPDRLDPGALQELRDMGPGFTQRVLPGFLHNAPITASAIGAAAARHDMLELATLAHKFSGSSGALAGFRLAATCTAVEQAAKRGDITAVRTLTATIEAETEATCQALSAALNLDEPTPAIKLPQLDVVKAARILVVDDDEIIRELITTVLSSAGLDITTARDGRAALALIDRNLPDLVVLDVMMPDLSGMEVCRQIRSNLRTAHLPIIMLTAQVHTQSETEGLTAGADLYLPKPVSPRYLLAKIEMLLWS
jgi:PAS domain S-box-containing protein